MTGRKRRGKLTSEERYVRRCAQLDAAQARWKLRYDTAETDDEKIAAAYDWNRAAIRMAREWTGPELGDMYAETLRQNLAKLAEALCNDIGLML